MSRERKKGKRRRGIHRRRNHHHPPQQGGAKEDKSPLFSAQKAAGIRGAAPCFGPAKAEEREGEEEKKKRKEKKERGKRKGGTFGRSDAGFCDPTIVGGRSVKNKSRSEETRA